MSLPTRIDRPARTHAIALCVAVLAFATAVRGEDAGPVVVVTSRTDGPYAGVVSGVRSSFDGRAASVDLQVHSLRSGREKAMEALEQARRSGRRPLIAIGSTAASAALAAPGKAPVVACMIPDLGDLEKVENATGVTLEFPLETQLDWIRRFVPDSHSIGVVYNPGENSERVARAVEIAEGLGLRLIARAVNRPQELPAALDSLAQEADLLFALTDQMVLSPKTAQAILLFSFRHRMPFSGLSASWVKAGALYSLERDYEDLGAQCAEMAVEILNGRHVDSVPPAMPRKVVYAVNLKTAEHLRLRLAPDLVDGAVEVFR